MSARMVTTAVTAALALTFVPGESDPTAILESEKTVIESGFEEAIDYWTARGIGLKAVKLVFLEHDEELFCDQLGFTASFDRAFYCRSMDQIVFPKGFFDAKRSAGEVKEEDLLDSAHHEVGHSVQDALGISNGGHSQLLIESQAVCLSGASMKAVAPEAVPVVIEQYEARGFSPGYGTGAELAHHFQNGANGENCFVMTAG